MKRIFVGLIALLFASNVFAQYAGTFKDDGSHTYETTMLSLWSRSVWEEVVILNNSSYELNNVSCLITLDDASWYNEG